MKTRKLPQLFTSDEFQEIIDAYDGLCTFCGNWTEGGVEPDAVGYECGECGAEKVMGAENALLMGFVGIK